MFDIDRLRAGIERLDPDPRLGRVVRVLGSLVESDGPDVSLGELCRLEPGGGSRPIPAEVVGFSGSRILLMPLLALGGLDNKTLVVPTGGSRNVPVGPALIGRVIDGLGKPIDELGELGQTTGYPLHAPPPPPLKRKRVDRALALGIKAIDACATCGKGQRIGIFAAAGVGKSTLLGMVARGSGADVNVIALIGERGREVRDFIERDLGKSGMSRTVLVVSTSADPPLARVRAAFLATSVAEYFRDQGKDVLLIMDSLTRFALAQREIGLAVGEQPTSRGYTPSVFSQLPRLLERSGTSDMGTITGLYSVLVEGNDPDEPVADAARGLLDGHILLSRDLAERGHFPAIDVCASLSRVMRDISRPVHQKHADAFRRLLAAFREVEDLLMVGAYRPGSNPLADEAIAKRGRIESFLRQSVDELYSMDTTLAELAAIVDGK